MRFLKVLLTLFCFTTLTSCYRCINKYTIDPIEADIKIVLQNYDTDSEWGYSPHFYYDIDDDSSEITDVIITFLDDDLDTIQHNNYYYYDAGDIYYPGNASNFREFKREVRVFKIHSYPVEFGLSSFIKEDEFTLIINTKVRNNKGILMSYKNSYKLTAEKNCYFHGALH